MGLGPESSFSASQLSIGPPLGFFLVRRVFASLMFLPGPSGKLALFIVLLLMVILCENFFALGRGGDPTTHLLHALYRQVYIFIPLLCWRKVQLDSWTLEARLLRRLPVDSFLPLIRFHRSCSLVFRPPTDFFPMRFRFPGLSPRCLLIGPVFPEFLNWLRLFCTSYSRNHRTPLWVQDLFLLPVGDQDSLGDETPNCALLRRHGNFEACPLSSSPRALRSPVSFAGPLVS